MVSIVINAYTVFCFSHHHLKVPQSFSTIITYNLFTVIPAITHPPPPPSSSKPFKLCHYTPSPHPALQSLSNYAITHPPPTQLFKAFQTMPLHTLPPPSSSRPFKLCHYTPSPPPSSSRPFKLCHYTPSPHPALQGLSNYAITHPPLTQLFKAFQTNYHKEGSKQMHWTKPQRFFSPPESLNELNNNNDPIERHDSRLFTISSLPCKLPPTCARKRSVHNRVQIVCNTSSTYHVQNILCHVVQSDCLTIQFDRADIISLFALFYWLNH